MIGHYCTGAAQPRAGLAHVTKRLLSLFDHPQDTHSRSDCSAVRRPSVRRCASVLRGNASRSSSAAVRCPSVRTSSTTSMESPSRTASIHRTGASPKPRLAAMSPVFGHLHCPYVHTAKFRPIVQRILRPPAAPGPLRGRTSPPHPARPALPPPPPRPPPQPARRAPAAPPLPGCGRR
jgi:hypothetical protein